MKHCLLPMMIRIDGFYTALYNVPEVGCYG